jgi:hypothetical protein
MKCDVCGRELSPGEGFVRLEAYVVVSKDVFRPSAGSPGGVTCVTCWALLPQLLTALLGRSPAPERSGS